MYKKMRPVLLVSAVFLTAGVLWLGTGTSRAQEEDAQTNQTETANSYEYVAKKNDNLSKMVRRSIQLYAQAKNISLTPAAAMYCETNAVKTLGSRRLALSEHVSIPFGVLQQYIDSSNTLTPRQLAAWDVYADKANFNLAGLEPVNVTVTQQSVEQPVQTNQETSDSTSDTGKNSNNGSSTTTDWYWWVIALAFVAILYYLFVNREPAPKSRSQNRRRRK